MTATQNIQLYARIMIDSGLDQKVAVASILQTEILYNVFLILLNTIPLMQNAVSRFSSYDTFPTQVLQY